MDHDWRWLVSYEEEVTSPQLWNVRSERRDLTDVSHRDAGGQSDKGQCGEETKHQTLLRVWACKEANKPWRSSLLWH